MSRTHRPFRFAVPAGDAAGHNVLVRRAILFMLLATACGAAESRPPDAPMQARPVSSSAPIAGDGGDSNASSAPQRREATSSQDATNVRETTDGDAANDSFGEDRLGLSDVEEGDGGRGKGDGQGIGLGNFGRLGGSRQPDGGPVVNVPRIRQGAIHVTGRIPQEVIQRIVHQNYGRFRLCYESGLQRDTKLRGLVQVTFDIDGSGNVEKVRDAGSHLTDPRVVQCIVQGFNNLSFPQPESGTVTVVYTVTLSPGD